MPRRRDAIKYRELPTLLRDARPTLGEIGDRSAIEALVKIYRAAEKRGDLARLDVRVRNFYEDLRASGHLPTSKGGSPKGKRHRRLLLAIKVHEAIAAHGKKRRNVESALREVADCLGDVSYNYLKEIYYDRDPKWRRDVEVELDRRKCEVAVTKSSALWFWEVQSTWWRPWVEEVPRIWAKGL